MLERLLQDRVATLVGVTMLVILAVGALSPGFLAVTTVTSIWTNALTLMCLAIGLLPVLLMRQIDVSGGSVLGLAAAVLGLALQSGQSLAISVSLTLLTGAGAGLLNGLLVTGLGVPAIVATLGTLGLFRGAMLIATGGEWIENLPDSLKRLASAGDLGLSPLSLAVLAVIIGAFIVGRSRRWQWLKAVGDNREAARHLGLPVRRLELAGFVFSGVCAALGGIVFAAQIGFIPNQAGNGLELRAIAALVLGGVSLLGGTGRVSGVVIGVLFLTAIDTALIFMKIPAYWNNLVGGALLLGVLLLDGRLRLLIERRDLAIRNRHLNPAPAAERPR